jgi:hypothetical protein
MEKPMLRSIHVVLILCFLPRSILGAPFQPVVALSSSYIPGQAVSFDVRLPDITNLGSYNIDVALESDVGTAGVDYYFDAAATTPVSVNYVFPSATNYFAVATLDSATRHRITLTDFDFSGVNVASGVNDRVATVVFRTAATFDGPLRLFCDAPLLILDTPDVTPTPVPGFSAIQDDITAAGPVELLPVPEPATVVLLALASGISVKRRRTNAFVSKLIPA